MRTLLLLTLLFTTPAFATPADVAALEAKGVKIKKSKEGLPIDATLGPEVPITADDYAALGRITTLTRTYIVPKSLTFDDAAAAKIEGLDKLEIFFANGAKLTDSGYKSLGKLKSLKQFGLDHWFRADKTTPLGAGLVELAACPNLKTIRLGGCDVGPEATQALAQIKTLEKVDLFHTRYVNDDAVAHLKPLPNLKHIILAPQYSGRLTDAALKHLSEIPTLEQIELKETRLTYVAGLSHLKKLKNLKRLNLENTEIPEADLAQLQADLPNLKIEKTTPDEVGLKRLKSAFDRLPKK